ncbi:MAG TPA: amidohydrolase family protein [Candidatus Methylomirabilis sp.]|nr:amidohydrolase family protein [Candidatus Methylomirabilis sp.]
MSATMSDPKSLPTVDAHGHLVPGELVELLRAGQHGIKSIMVTPDDDGIERWYVGTDSEGRPFQIRPFPKILSDVDERLLWMDAQGIDVQCVSTWGELHGYHLDPTECSRWSRLTNQYLLTAVADEERLRPFATIPLGSPELAAAEMKWAASVGFSGVMCGVHSGTLPLDDQAYTILWEEASNSGLVVYLHPDYPYWNERLRGELLAGSLGRAMDTATAVARLITSGVFHRYPSLKVVASHGGGGLPFLWGRLRHCMRLASSEYLTESMPPGLYFDSVVHDPTTLGCLVDEVGADHLILGSDYPFPLLDPRPVDTVREGVAGRGESVLEAILATNTARLFVPRTSIVV